MLKRELLYFEYIVNGKSMGDIAKEYNVAIGTVFNYIKKYNIEVRKHLNSRAKAKISNKNKGQVSPNKGKHLSEETKEKIKKAHLGKYTKQSLFGGHTKRRTDGYISVYVPNHPNASKDGYVMEHQLVMEQKIGRYLRKDEVVHHKNKNKADNKIDNLELMTFREHASYHMKERLKQKRGNALSTK